MSDKPKRIAKNQTLSDHLERMKQEKGIDHGGDIIIRCSNCDHHLLSLVVTRPDAAVQNQIVVECCHCGDKSFERRFNGMFALQPGEGTMMRNMNIENTETLPNGNTLMQIRITTGKN